MVAGHHVPYNVNILTTRKLLSITRSLTCIK